MSPEMLFGIYAAVAALVCVAVGWITNGSDDASFAFIAGPLWPIFAFIAIVLIPFYCLAALGIFARRCLSR